MSILANLSAKFGDFNNELTRLKGAAANKDILEAAVAGCVIVGAADGSYSEKEKDETIDLIMNSKFIEATGFSVTKVSEVAERYTNYRPGSRSGRERLLEEVAEAGRRPETAQFAKAIFMVWVDIAEAEGGIDDKEKDALIKLGAAIGLRDAAGMI